MISLFLAFIIVILFSVLLSALGGVRKSLEVIQVCRDSIRQIQDSNLADEDKEKVLQENSKRLFKGFISILLASALAGLLPLAGLWSLDVLGWVALESVIDVLESWEFILGITLVFTILGFIKKKYW